MDSTRSDGGWLVACVKARDDIFGALKETDDALFVVAAVGFHHDVILYYVSVFGKFRKTTLLKPEVSKIKKVHEWSAFRVSWWFPVHSSLAVVFYVPERTEIDSSLDV
mmetsp:Transcript_31048/g.51716  ORF Transcript_31048/g.51716 Transcript_31048/m.51716 type:complete len:108 (-) Transcript_31048:233-556(-)